MSCDSQGHIIWKNLHCDSSLDFSIRGSTPLQGHTFFTKHEI